jgi:hypothetical protein
MSLTLCDCNAEKIEGADSIKSTLNHLRVQHSIKSIKEMLLLGVGVGQWQGNDSILVPAWSSLTSADLSHNGILMIDESVVCMLFLLLTSSITIFLKQYNDNGHVK